MDNITLGSTVTIDVLGVAFLGVVTYCDSVCYVVMYAEKDVIKYETIKL